MPIVDDDVAPETEEDKRVKDEGKESGHEHLSESKGERERSRQCEAK